MALNFYEIPKLDDFTETNTDWIWNDLVPFGKIIPSPWREEVYWASSGGNYDFYMSVVPESSDLPTVMLGKAGDAQRTTYVYADSNTAENVSFVFNKEGTNIITGTAQDSSTLQEVGKNLLPSAAGMCT